LMKTKIIIVIICSTSQVLFSQQVYFNRTYTDSIDGCFTVVRVNDGYIIPINAWTNFSSKKFVITKVDNYGNIIYEKNYGNQDDYFIIYNCLLIVDSSLILVTYYCNHSAN